MAEQVAANPPSKGIEASDGSAFPLILEHYMLHPASYEIPLRSMYTLNCQTRPLAPNSGFKESAFASPAMQNATEPVADAASQFRAQLISHISKSPHQLSLPVGFMVSFVRRVFASTLENVDFPQALTALDYLKNVERRRQKDVLAAFKSLAIDLSSHTSPFLRSNLEQKQQLQQKYPGVVRWIESIEERDRKAHHYYKNVCLSLRRWILINEIWLEPFNKANCLAMLNTLFPPVTPLTAASTVPNGELKTEELSVQRSGFFNYIKTVERSGKIAIENVLKSGARPGEETAWPLVHEFLEKYLDLAHEMIYDCGAIEGRDDLEAEVRGKTHKRNADSGVSFGSVNESLTTDSRATTPSDKSRSSTPDSRHPKSTLEKINNQLRKMRSRSDNKEPGKPKSLSKKKSFTALVSGRSASSSSGESAFDVDEFKRKRMIWEANERKKEETAPKAFDK
ncbi:hypothetical protein BGW36DRAFT_385593 [Talaromyces proteolyticus]|uniref:Uncharacterized protein n=1 Tax=Talaromyces proteolyticus TaxID=1131652 RepID=A0AAD4PXB6_9EURO|nr:uncharacterized protein BGW36DRAFT_385593 [Talaromyces proteolyticus]KAH8692956.1 hypothetical protein BGW36DRAFT_385593 [Talaromyces proteolyticus]